MSPCADWVLAAGLAFPPPPAPVLADEPHAVRASADAASRAAATPLRLVKVCSSVRPLLDRAGMVRFIAGLLRVLLTHDGGARRPVQCRRRRCSLVFGRSAALVGHRGDRLLGGGRVEVLPT